MVKKGNKRTWNYGYVIRICRIFLVYKTKFNLISFSLSIAKHTLLTMLEITKLTQEEMDVVIYDSRVGDLETLQEIFDLEKLITPKTLTIIKDDITLSTPLHMAAANGHLPVVKYLILLLEKTMSNSSLKQRMRMETLLYIGHPTMGIWRWLNTW